MSDLNNFCFTGRLTKDAEFKTLATGKGLLVANVAINTGYGDYKKTLFAKVQQWGDAGSKIAQYLKKGTEIASSGELSTNVWTGNDGVSRTDILIDVRSIQFHSNKATNTEASASADEVVF